MLIKQLAGPLSDDWEIVHDQPITHPTNPSVRGALVQHRQTAVYRIAAAGALSSIDPTDAHNIRWGKKRI